MVMRLSINVHQADLGQSTLLNDPVGCHITLMCHGIYGHSIGLREQILDQGSNGLGRVSLIPEHTYPVKSGNCSEVEENMLKLG